MRALGIDYGTKRMGFAISDATRTISQPLSVLERKSLAADMEHIRSLVDKFRVTTIVVGLPKAADGSRMRLAREIIFFIKELKKHVNVPVICWDESLSTLSSEELLIEADVSRKKRKKVIDKIAASVILQHYLDGRKE